MFSVQLARNYLLTYRTWPSSLVSKSISDHSSATNLQFHIPVINSIQKEIKGSTHSNCSCEVKVVSYEIPSVPRNLPALF